MKCDELKEYKAYEYGTSFVYDIGEVTEAIEELKQFAEDACLERDDNQNAIDELQSENEQLKKEIEFMHSNCKWGVGDGCARLLGEKLAIIDDNVKLKQKLESVQASMYCDVVDANMENRRLKRALWLARAERAKYRVEYWACRGGALFEHYPFCVNGDSPFNRLSEIGCLYGDTNERLKEAKFKHLYASEWMLVWENVERKCRAKAEEYK